MRKCPGDHALTCGLNSVWSDGAVSVAETKRREPVQFRPRLTMHGVQP